MNKKSSNNDLQRWAALIEDAVSSGMTREKWCEVHGISPWSYYYWNRKVKDLKSTDENVSFAGTGSCKMHSSGMKPETDPVFYELPASVSDPHAESVSTSELVTITDMILEFGQFKLTIPKNVDVNTLQSVIQVVSHA